MVCGTVVGAAIGGNKMRGIPRRGLFTKRATRRIKVVEHGTNAKRHVHRRADRSGAPGAPKDLGSAGIFSAGEILGPKEELVRRVAKIAGTWMGRAG